MQKCEFCGSNVIAPSGVYKASDLMAGVNVGFGDFSGLGDLAGKAMKVAEIQQLIQSGNKIEAVKQFRQTFDVGLAEAAAAVEKMERGEGIDISGMQVISAGGASVGGQPRPASKGSSISLGKLLVTILIITVAFPVVLGVIILFLTGGLTWFALSEVNKATNKPAGTSQSPVRKAPPAPESPAKEILRFGGEGTGPGLFDDNRTVAVGPEGNIYSADRSTGRIQGFDPNGKFLWLTSIGSDGYVAKMGVTRSGKLFALTNNALRRFDAASGKEEASFKVSRVDAMALGVDGKIHLVTREGVTTVDAEGKEIGRVALPSIEELKSPSAAAVDTLGNFYISDTFSSFVYKIGPNGSLITRFGGSEKPGKKSESPAMFESSVTDIALDPKGRLFISEPSFVRVFTSDGNHLYTFNVSQAFGLAFRDNGELVVAQRPEIVKYTITDPN